MRILTIVVCTLAVLVTVTIPASAQRMPQDNWYLADEWGGGTPTWYFNYPCAVAIGPTGRVYIADRNNDKVHVYESDGTYVTQWGSGGSGEGQFGYLKGIAVDSSDYVYTVEEFIDYDRVQVFQPDGTFVRMWGSQGSETNQFNNPEGILVATNGLIYVADDNNNRIQVFQPDGTWVTNWATATDPFDIAMGPDGNLYVANYGPDRIYVYDQNGAFVRDWGGMGTGTNQLNGPTAIDVSTNGRVYVADAYNDRVQVFHLDGTWVTNWGVYGTGDGEFDDPEGIAVAPDGRVFVTDTDNHRIQIFDADGNFLEKHGEYGSMADGFYPHDIVLHTNGLLYTTDPGRERIQVFQKDGTFVKMWGSYGMGDGQFDNPYGIAMGPDGNLYIANTSDNEIKVFQPDGTFVREWGSSGNGDGQFNAPRDVAIDTNGFVYVADNNNDRVQVFQPDGTFVRKWGQSGTAPTEFGSVYAIAVGPDGLIYVADYGNVRIKVFQPDGAFVREWTRRASELFIAPDGLVVVKDYDRLYLYTPEGTLLLSFITHPDAMDNGSCMDDEGTIFSCYDNGGIRVFRRTYRTSGSAPPNAPPQPSVLSAAQRPGTSWLDIDYSVIDGDSSNVTVAALALVDGNNDLAGVLKLNTLEENTATNLGAGIPTGEKRRLTWNAGADWATEIGQAKVRVMASDGRDLIDFHFITIPSNGPNPELTISRSPVLQSDLLYCWFWMIATNDPSLTLMTGAVECVSGVYSGKVLAVSTDTTADGRAFLFDRMNVEGASPAEVDIAREGGTPGTTNMWDPRIQIGPEVRPKKLNEYGFDTGDWGTEAWWVKPKP